MGFFPANYMLNVPPRSAANEDSMRLGGNYGSGGSATVGKGVPRVAGRNVQTGGQDFSPWDGSPSKKTEPDETNIFFYGELSHSKKSVHGLDQSAQSLEFLTISM